MMLLLTWGARWDDWVSTDRIRKDTEENKELARNIKRTYDNQRIAAISKPGANKRRGDDSLVEDDKMATGRGKRGRNMEIETVSINFLCGVISCAP